MSQEVLLCSIYNVVRPDPRHLILDLILQYTYRNEIMITRCRWVASRQDQFPLLSFFPRIPARSHKETKGGIKKNRNVTAKMEGLDVRRWALSVWVCSDSITRGNQADIAACERKFGPEVRDG